MRVSDIYTDCQSITGYADQATNFSRISDSIEVLSNKGLIDALQGYLEIPTTSSRIVTLPRDVETPIQVNVGDNPSFSRTKLFEFSMNGPGSSYTPTDWAWEDRGSVPVLVQPSSATTVRVVSTSASDITSYTVRIWGRLAAVAPNTLGQEVDETLTLNGISQVTSTNSYASITRILKTASNGIVTLSTSGGVTLSIYAPSETEPEYRQIRLSKSGTTAHILFRRSVYRVSTMNDWIPVQSRMGLLLMLRANEFYRKATAADIQTGQALEKQAEKFVEEEQKSRNAFAEVASQTQRDSVYGLNINNRDSIIVADIYDDVAKICGPIGQNNLFDRITDGLELLSNKGQWEGLEGYVDLSVDNQRYVTLPRYVDVPIAINIGHGPSKMRNRYFEFHLNGPGSSCPPCNGWEDHGDVVTITDLTEAQGLIYKPDSSADNGKTITVYGYDENDRNITITLTGNSSYAFANISVSKIKRIDRISRDFTSGFAQLISYNSDGTIATQLGYYYPDETEPTYRRIRIPCSTCWVRMRYKKRTLKVSSLSDPLHLKSRLAILAAIIGSIQALRSEKPDIQLSEALEAKAVKYLCDNENVRNPGGKLFFQFDPKIGMSSPEHSQF